MHLLPQSLIHEIVEVGQEKLAWNSVVISRSVANSAVLSIHWNPYHVDQAQAKEGRCVETYDTMSVQRKRVM